MYRPNQRGYSSYTQTMTNPNSSGSGTTTNSNTSSTQASNSNIFSRTGTILSSNSTNSGSAGATTRNGTTTNSDEIIFAVVTGNFSEVTRLVNSSNVNNVIDIKNRYTALHYAVKQPNNEIVGYLMNCGADPNIKQNEGKDSIDLSIESNKRYLINIVIAKNEKELDELYVKYDEKNYDVKTLERKNKELNETNNYLQKTNSDYVHRIEELKEENKSIKRKLDESEKAFENLLKKNRK